MEKPLDAILSEVNKHKGVAGETVLCHIYPSENMPGTVVCQEVSEELKKSGDFGMYPVLPVTLPAYLVEVTQVFDDVIPPYSFIKVGLVTEKQIEDETPPYGFKDNFTSYGDMAEDLLKMGVAGFVYNPAPRNGCGYCNHTRRFILPITGLRLTY